VNALDEQVLGDDEPVAELGRVVSDVPREPASLQLGEQAELAELREPHRSPSSTQPRRAPNE